MRRITTFLIAFIFIYGCSSDTDQDTNSIAPLAPTNLTGSILNNQILLTWLDNSTNEIGFKIERKVGAGVWLEIGSVNSNVYNYTDSSVNYGTTYTYRVYAFNSSGSSINYSNEVIITTFLSLTTNVITDVTNVSASCGGDISFSGGSSVIVKGVVWSTNPTPSIMLPTKTTDGSGAGSYTSSLTGLSPNTTYYVRAYATNVSGTAYGNEITFSTMPVITTTNVTNIGTTTTTSGGNISIGGGATISSRGVVWSTNSSPSIILPTKTTDGSGAGSYTSSLTGLSPNTTYYLRAYATNFSGTTYGNEITFTSAFQYNYTQGQTLTDIDGNVYQTITNNCNNKTWMQSNLNVSKFKNGDIIPQVTSPSEFPSTGGPAWCYYNNETANGIIYGKLYNRIAIIDPRGLAPEGWHISTDIEWSDLINCLGGSTIAGGKLKATGTQFWSVPNLGASNSSGFKALPGGWRTNNGSFGDLNTRTYFWADNASFIPPRYVLFSSQENVEYMSSGVTYGFSVRCVKNN
jgi:uncharacterized protein (TIGR02145 family)